MATNRNSTRKNTKKFKPVEIEANGKKTGYFLHYRENEWGLFGLEHNGAVIYGCKLFEGDNGIFVSYPARKGSDGKYYTHARFTETVPDEVIEGIADAIGF